MPRLFHALFLWLLSVSGGVAEDNDVVTRIAFGSCCKESLPSPIFEAITAFRPDVWIWMGDNIYGDSNDVAVLEKKWARQKANPGYQKLRQACQVIGTWDDHDYGRNDAGSEYVSREASQQAFLDFLDIAKDDPRRQRAGVYASHVFGPSGKRVKVVLLDTRYHRDKPGPDGDILGEAQWQWLEKELAESEAHVNLLVSSIQVVPAEHRWEKWHNFPTAIARLCALLARKDIPPVTILSGDRHLAEISAERKAAGYLLYDITSSSLNVPFRGTSTETNTRRVGKHYEEANFGTLEIDWSVTPPVLDFAIRNENGEPALQLSGIRQEK